MERVNALGVKIKKSPDSDETRTPSTVRVEDLVTMGEVSRRTGHKLATVKSWGARHDSFPEPLIRGVYWWPAVDRWLTENVPYGRKIEKRDPSGNTNTPSVP